MKKAFLTMMVLSLGVMLAFGQTKIINPDTLVKRLGDKYIKNPSSVGISVGLFYNGKTYTYNFGTTEKGKNLLPTENTIYELGSITKTFISFLLAKEVEENKVKLDDDIRKYLDGDYPNLEYDGKPITLVQLANTISGIPNSLPPLPASATAAPEDSQFFVARRFEERITRQDFFDALHHVKLDTIPGYKAQHSNGAAQLLAYILEKIYGAPYPELVKRYISEPLDMKNTGFLAGKSGSPMLAKGYFKGDAVSFFNSSALSGAGGISSTTADMLKYIKLQLDKQNKVAQLTHKKTVSVDVYGIALNWFVYKYDDGNSQVWTDGSTLGFYDFIILYPELNAGIVLLTNEADTTSYKRLSDFADKIFNAIKQK